MSGKTYTMKEMKTIVDYLKTHSSYGDIKGRKMWMDFASSSLTNRTWQSLKETFLKRILPDIHNPYYNLTRDEILSFKQGFDINLRRKNKLEIHTISDDSNSAENQKDHEQPSTSKMNGGEKATGENTKSSKIDSHDRASTETVILDPCYETPQDIQRVLESPKNGSNEDSGDNIPSTKTLRDFITYAEPLTPMLQEVLDDFATDDEEPELQIVENEVPDTNDGDPNVSPRNITNNISNSENNKDIIHNNIPKSQNIEKPLEEQIQDIIGNSDTPDNLKTTSAIVESSKITEAGLFENRSQSIFEQLNINMCPQKSDDSNNKPNNHSEEVTVCHKSLERNETENCSHSTSDTILPGNQEALKTNVSIKKSTDSLKVSQLSKKGNKINLGRKRSNSDIKPNQEKKKKLIAVNNKLKSVSEAGSSTEDKQIDFKIPSPVKKQLAEASDPSRLEKQVKDNIINNETITSTKEKKSEDENNGSLPSQMNPCLNSVSLYAEQFNKTKYTDSDSSEKSKANNNNKNKNKNHKNKIEILHGTRKTDAEAVVMVQSHSESDNENIVERNNVNKDESDNKNTRNVSNSQRDKALASVFGFACGGNRKRKLSSRKSSHRYYSHSNTHLESSEWTSDSEDEYVSPPRGRKSKQHRKYLKPKSARILSLDEEGGLFVMHDKKIYPLVKDGKIIKNYLTYSSESDTEEDPSYWKRKYEEEKIKAEGLKKLLEESKENNKVRACSPILPITAMPKLCTAHPHSPITSNLPIIGTEVEPSEVKPSELVKDIRKPENTLKIRFTKNNEELHVEGHWSHIHPVLADVVQLFNKDSEQALKNTNVSTLINTDMPPKIDVPRLKDANSTPMKNANVPAFKDTDSQNEKIDEPVAIDTNGKEDNEVITIGSTAGVDEEVHEKVAKLESEIFKEIEERDKEGHEETDKEGHVETDKEGHEEADKEAQNETIAQDEHVNKRRGRQRKSSTTKLQLSPSSSESRTSLRMKNKREQAAKEVDDGGTPINTKQKNVTTRKSNERNSNANNTNLNPLVADEDEDMSTFRYKLPTARKTREKKIPQKFNNAAKSKLKTNTKSQSNVIKINTQVAANLSLKSESTQGYQDSDISPARDMILLKRKRKLSLSMIIHRSRNRQRHFRRRSYPDLADDASSESSNLSFRPPTKFKTNKLPPSDNSSPNTDVYRSDSYQLLVPKEKRRFELLDKIDETSPLYNDVDMTVHNSNLQDIVDAEMFNLYKDSSNSSVRQNCSNVSLPLSPELSVVDNISISKELLSGIEDQPTINETQANNLSVNAMYNKYMMSEIDVTMPLMAQDCEIQKSVSPNQRLHGQKLPAVSDSFLDKINSVNIADAPSISDSLDSKLKNLLLESAKKMQVDTTEITRLNNAVIEKKTRARKRCSTPRKKTNTAKFKTAEVEPVVEEEHMECCSYGGRRSCPPAIQILSEVSLVENDEINISSNEPVKTKGRKKKDIIKVKILKPTRRDSKKRKSAVKCASQERAQDQCNISVHTDSGINEPVSGLFIQISDDSVDLIHNHSETCLQTKECLDDSVEFVEPLTKSIISLNTNSEQFFRDSFLDIKEFRDAKNIPPEVFCNNAHDGISNKSNATSTTRTNSVQTSDTIYHSPNDDMSNSLITEDLSDEFPCQSSPSKWYLLSENETNDTTNGPSFGANLMHIFPLTCAVPNLSTVTEMSKENEGASLSGLNSDTRNELDSQSIF